MICDLCKELIEIEKERYIHVEDWKRERKIKEIWCHLKCFHNAMNKDLNKIGKDAKELLYKLKPMLEKIIIPKEVSVI